MMLKSVFDVVIAAVALLLLSPVLLVIAAAVRLDSPGPAFFRQRRVGEGERCFTLLKFRSMVENADRIAANVSPDNDPRITRVGAFLRHSYLDELPQLINVVKGDMSLVGPRPETPEFVARYTPEERKILSVKPGLVGPSTLAFMDEPEILASSVDPETYYVDVMMHQRVRLDLGYLSHRSLRYDIGLLLRQLFAIVRHQRKGESAVPPERAEGETRWSATIPWASAGAVLAAIVALSLGPDIMAGLQPSFWESLAHIGAYAALTWVLLAIPKRSLDGRSGRSWPEAAGLAISVVVLGALVEVGQAALHRDADWIDIMRNATGVGMALGGWLLVRAHRSRPATQVTGYEPDPGRNT